MLRQVRVASELTGSSWVSLIRFYGDVGVEGRLCHC